MFGLSDDKSNDHTANNFAHNYQASDDNSSPQTSDSHGDQAQADHDEPAQGTSPSFWSDSDSGSDDTAPVPPPAGSASTDTPVTHDDSTQNAPSDELLDLKRHALQDLAPLVNHLDQTPEEKFKTTMMLIQASDNASLVHEAYQAANAIQDEKTRAQALLDVVNEINYFTHQPTADKPSED